MEISITIQDLPPLEKPNYSNFAMRTHNIKRNSRILLCKSVAITVENVWVVSNEQVTSFFFFSSINYRLELSIKFSMKKKIVFRRICHDIHYIHSEEKRLCMGGKEVGATTCVLSTKQMRASSKCLWDLNVVLFIWYFIKNFRYFLNEMR